jgi:hypothetical protein
MEQTDERSFLTETKCGSSEPEDRYHKSSGGAQVKADLCFQYSSNDWKNLVARLDHDEADWAEAIGVFERRMKERFFTSIDALVKADTKPDPKRLHSRPEEPHCIPGFSIMALCCLLVETLQGFRERTATTGPSGPCTYPSGPCVKPSPDTTGQFIKFLRRPAFRGAFAEDKIAKSFVRGIRNGILHEAETRKWLIWREAPTTMVQPLEDGYVLNRTMFYEAVKQEFESYLNDLRDPTNAKLRETFKGKMSDIRKES